MSALSTSRPPHTSSLPAPPTSPSLSPVSSYSPLPSLSHSSPCSPSSSSSSLISIPERTNEHLAVLLPKQLWKPDSLASQCDNFYCSVRFSILERRHHCRKCGGVFCAACSSRDTPLLDASNLSFLHPPRNVPLSSFASPISPIIRARVCDDCYAQIHGIPLPRTPDLVRPSLAHIFTSPVSIFKSPLSASPSLSGTSSLASSVLTTPPHPLASDPPSILTNADPIVRKTHSLCAAPSSSSLNSVRRTPLRTAHLTLPADLERSYGELDSYPLRRSSIVCKATGGGRWEPKQEPVDVGYRPPVPGGKAPFELQMEREEKEARQRRENPIVRDGVFQYRFPRHPDPPMVMARSPFTLSTF